ncbi:MAG TPA: hypothetical protein VGU68_08790 [Ktedonobacteraceae bacterium]|nr:hypothetical protein [Ktedonobacteraceae bacterium]
MGQYQQWLYHREVEQQLQARLEQLLHEMQILQEQAVQLEEGAACSANPILQAIALQQSFGALFASKQAPESQVTPSTPHLEVAVAPEDMAAFIDMHAPTTPRLHAARLVPQSEEKAPSEQEVQADDRMNYSIQRWRERWGRQTATVSQSTTDQQELREDTAE